MQQAKQPYLNARPFDPHRRATSDSMRNLIKDVMVQLDGYELFMKERKRKRSESAQKIYELTVEAILCDLVYRELEQPRGRVHLSQSNQVLRKASRYKGKAMGKTLPFILKVMSSLEMGFIKLIPGKAKFSSSEGSPTIVGAGKQTIIAADGSLLRNIDTFGVSVTDIGRSEDEETILLRGKKSKGDQPGPLIEYKDTEETDLLRQQLTEINCWLAQADLDHDHDDVKLTDRRLRRIFNNGDFQQGGRLYGGFWQRMKHSDRLTWLYIDGDTPVELDYGQTALLILYGLEDAQVPSGDLYDLSEFGIPATCRPGIKKVIQASINSEKPLKRMPMGARTTLPKTFSLNQVMDAIHKKHPLISHRFNEGLGLKLMRAESDILIEVLLALKNQKIVALPVHDAVLVNGNYEQEAKAVMVETFKRHTGLVPEVTASYA